MHDTEYHEHSIPPYVVIGSSERGELRMYVCAWTRKGTSFVVI